MYSHLLLPNMTEKQSHQEINFTNEPNIEVIKDEIIKNQ